MEGPQDFTRRKNHSPQGQNKNQITFLMKLHIEKSELTNPTLMHLEAWLLAIDEHLQNDHVFNNLDELATNLESWRSEFCRGELECHWGDQVTVMVYGNEIILISDQRSGEFIKVKEHFPKVIISDNTRMMLKNAITKALAMMVMLFCFSNPVQAEGIWPFKKTTGISVAKANQKSSVKLGKKNMKGLKKASKTVNARLSREGGNP